MALATDDLRSMASLRHILVLLTLVAQAAFGPAGLTLDVCHGRLQWAAPSGETCCGPTECVSEEPVVPTCGCDHGDHGTTIVAQEVRLSSTAGSDDTAQLEEVPCTACFQIALEGADEAFDTWTSDELAGPTIGYMAHVVIEVLPGCAPRVEVGPRAPPGAVPRTGLLPGTFPLRI